MGGEHDGFVLAEKCEERHRQMQQAHEDKHGDVLVRLKEAAESMKDIDKGVSVSLERVHERIDDMADTLNKEVRNMSSSIAGLEGKMKNLVITILVSILVSVLGTVVSYTLSAHRENSSLAPILKGMSETQALTATVLEKLAQKLDPSSYIQKKSAEKDKEH